MASSRVEFIGGASFVEWGPVWAGAVLAAALSFVPWPLRHFSVAELDAAGRYSRPLGSSCFANHRDESRFTSALRASKPSLRDRTGNLARPLAHP
jgi:hypothetical protein